SATTTASSTAPTPRASRASWQKHWATSAACCSDANVCFDPVRRSQPTTASRRGLLRCTPDPATCPWWGREEERIDDTPQRWTFCIGGTGRIHITGTGGCCSRRRRDFRERLRTAHDRVRLEHDARQSGRLAEHPRPVER